MESTTVSIERLVEARNWGYPAHSQRALDFDEKVKSSAYPIVLLGEYINGLAGGLTPRGARYPDSGVLFIRVGNIQPHGLDLSDVKYIDEELHQGELRRCQLQENDVLLAITGATFGKSCLVPVGLGALFSVEIKDPTLEPEVPFCYIDIASIDVQSGEIVDVKEIRGRDAPSRARQVVHSGDIVVSTVRPTRGATAIVTDHMDGFICSTGFAVVRANGKVLPEYLYIALRLSTTREQLGRRSSGSSYPAVLIKDIKETLIPVPNIEVQETIVAEVKKRKAVASQLKNAAQALVTQAKQQVERLILGEEIV